MESSSWLVCPSYQYSTLIIFWTIGYVAHSFFIPLGIANVNWVFNISNKYLFGYFNFSIGYFCKCWNFTYQLVQFISYCCYEQKMLLTRYIGESAWPVKLPFFKEVIIYDDRKPFLGEMKSNPGRAPILGHDSQNNVKHSWKYSRSLAGNRTRVAPVQDQLTLHWAKESTHWRSCQKLNIY